MREMVEAALERYLLALAGPGATGEVFVVRDSLGTPTVMRSLLFSSRHPRHFVCGPTVLSLA